MYHVNTGILKIDNQVAYKLHGKIDSYELKSL